jgi:hypothetical protein
LSGFFVFVGFALFFFFLGSIANSKNKENMNPSSNSNMSSGWQPDSARLAALVDLLKLSTMGDSGVQAEIFQVSFLL